MTNHGFLKKILKYLTTNVLNMDLTVVDSRRVLIANYNTLLLVQQII